MAQTDRMNPDLPPEDTLLEQLARATAIRAGDRQPISDDDGWAMVVAKEPSLGRPSIPSRHAALNAPQRMWGGTRSWLALGAVAAVGLVTVLSLNGRGRNAPTPAQQFHTRSGQHAVIQLAQGSSMALGPSTTVTITAEGAAVSGEAYFTLEPRAERPFTVKTRNAIVRVLGTRFVVRQYANESVSRVIVDDGKVALRLVGARTAADSNIVLAAATAAQVTDSGITVRSGILPGTYNMLSQGRLVFGDTPLTDVVRDLSRAYGVEVRVSDSALARRTMSLTATVNEVTLNDILRSLALTMNAHVTHDGSALVITPGRAAEKSLQDKRVPESEKYHGK